jgi:predicted nucleotide-binding protein
MRSATLRSPRRAAGVLKPPSDFVNNMVYRSSESPVPHGTQLRTAQGPILTVYHSGALVPGGKRQDLLKPILDADDGKAAPARVQGGAVSSRKVFVVYGHEATTRSELEAMLRRWGLEPLILDQLPSGGQPSLRSWRVRARRQIMQSC